MVELDPVFLLALIRAVREDVTAAAGAVLDLGRFLEETRRLGRDVLEADLASAKI
jgi:hypothetical protein